MTTPDFSANPDFSTGHDYYPDGLTRDAITALQRDVNRELRREGYPVPYGQRPATRRPVRDPVEPTTDQTTGPTVGPASAETTPAPESCASPLPDAHRHPGGNGAAEGVGPSAGEPAGDPAPMLFTPAQAAQLLQVPESWLRRRAARRQVPCTSLGKHLRFSRANLDKIIVDAARPTATAQRPAPGASTAPRRRGRPPARARTNSRRPTR
jgi:excisionase family DNA binding protein